ncbi:MAG: VOC family protein, partial [Candidatus Nitrosopolaris sp.]
SDMKESMKFYKDVLGMEVKQQTEDWVEFSKQGTVLALHPSNEEKAFLVNAAKQLKETITETKNVNRLLPQISSS